MKDVAWQLNVKRTRIVHQVPNVFNRIVNQNVEKFVRKYPVDQMPNVFPSSMLHSVNVCQAMVERLLI